MGLLFSALLSNDVDYVAQLGKEIQSQPLKVITGHDLFIYEIAFCSSTSHRIALFFMSLQAGPRLSPESHRKYAFLGTGRRRPVQSASPSRGPCLNSEPSRRRSGRVVVDPRRVCSADNAGSAGAASCPSRPAATIICCSRAPIENILRNRL